MRDALTTRWTESLEHRNRKLSKKIAISVACVAVLGLFSSGWLLLPLLQSPERKVQADAETQLERARRLLHGYNAGLAYKSLLVDQLDEQGIQVDPEALTDDIADEYQRVHTRLWETYPPTDWLSRSPSPVRAQYGNIDRQIRDGLRVSDRITTGNEDLLDQALAAVDRALAVTRGEVSSRSYAEATRLKAVILYHKGLAGWIQARLRRRRAQRYRRALARLAADAISAAGIRTLVADSHIGDQIERLREEAGKLEAAISADREAQSALNETIHDLEARLADARARTDRARQALDDLKAEANEFSDPEAAKRLRARILARNEEFRAAVREAHTLQYGHYPDAQIDETGDLLHGRYVVPGSTGGPSIQFGLVHYRSEHDVLTARMEGKRRALNDLRADIDRLESTRNRYEGVQSEAARGITQAVEEASDAYSELSRIESEAFVVEDAALDQLERAARMATQAASFAERWMRSARDRIQGLSPEAKGRSAFDTPSRDRWIGAYMASQEADARLVKAWIHYDRYQAYTRDGELLARVLDSVPLAEADVEAERNKAGQARRAGVDEVGKAMKVLEQAHQKTGKNWTIAAQAAGTTYLLALFGYDEYVQDTVEAYQSAIKGREKEPFAEVFVARLNRLENR